MTAVADKARRAEWRLHELNTEMMLALEESGGEVTPTVEEIEARMLEQVDDLAELGVGIREHAQAQQELCKRERARIQREAQYWHRLELLGNRWLRQVAEEKGERFEVGTHRVSFRSVPASAKLDGWVVSRSDKWVDDDQIHTATMDDMISRGLARRGIRFDSSAIVSELKKGAEVAGFVLHKPTEKSVVVK